MMATYRLPISSLGQFVFAGLIGNQLGEMALIHHENGLVAALVSPLIRVAGSVRSSTMEE